MSKGKFCEKDSDGKFCHGIVPCMKSYLSGSSEDQQECQKETDGFYGKKLHKACKIPKNLNFPGLFIKLSQDRPFNFFWLSGTSIIIHILFVLQCDWLKFGLF